MKRMLWLLLMATSVMLLGGCQTLTSASGPTPNSVQVRTPTGNEESAQMIKRVLTDQEKYVGKNITIEGILEAEGQGLSPRFFLRNDAGERVEVSPWAPLEVVQRPGGEVKVKTMLDFVGRRLRLTGTVEKAPSGSIILKVASAEEL